MGVVPGQFPLVGGVFGVSGANMPKGGGNNKGKQPAKRPTLKRPDPGQAGDGPELSVAGQWAILEQFEALERAHGLPSSGPSGGVPGKKGWVTRQVSQQYFHSMVTAKTGVTPADGSGEVPWPDVPVHQDLVSRELVPRPSGGHSNTGESHTAAPQFT